MATSQYQPNGSSVEERKTYDVTAADGRSIIKNKRFYLNTKDRTEAVAKDSSLSADARQYYARLELQTMGFHQERAVKMIRGGDLVDYTPSDLGNDMDPPHPKQRVRRGLEELEKKGLAERCQIIAGKGWIKGNVAINSWAVPRKSKIQKGSRARYLFPESSQAYQQLASLTSPEELEAITGFVRRFKIHVDPDKVVAREAVDVMLVAFAKLKEAEEVAVATAEGYLAPAPLYKDEINGNIEEKEEAGRQASTVVEEEPSLPACPPPVENQNGNRTPEITTAEQILELPEVQQLQVETGDVISRKLARDVAADLRDAPVEGFGRVLALRRKRGQFHAGLLRNLASGYADSNDIHKRSVQAKADSSAQQMDEQTRRTCRDLWERYNESEREQALRDQPYMPWPSG